MAVLSGSVCMLWLCYLVVFVCYGVLSGSVCVLWLCYLVVFVCYVLSVLSGIW